MTEHIVDNANGQPVPGQAEASGLRRARRWKQARAIAAAGVVLGVGAAVTLAAWNDSEFATDTFTSGAFVFQGSTDGSTWADHASQAGAASLNFSTGFDNLTPNDTVYAPYALKLTGTSDAEVTALAPAITGGLAGQLTFDARVTSSFGCDSTAFAGGTAVPATVELVPTGQVNLCLKVTSSATIPQAQTGTVVWQWDAVSV